MARILVTGATGFLGQHLVRELIASGHEVTGFSRSARQLPPGAHVLAGDILDKSSVERACEGHHAVVHLVGIIRERREETFEAVHVQGTKNVAAAAKNAGVRRLVYVSALGASPHAKSRFLATKYEAELIVKQSGIPCAILRPAIIIGKGDSHVSLARRMLGFPIVPIPRLFSRARIQPIAVQDVAKGLAAAVAASGATRLECDAPGPEALTLADFLARIRSRLGSRARFVTVPDSLAALAMRLPFMPFSAEQLLVMAGMGEADADPAGKASLTAALGIPLTKLDDALRQALVTVSVSSRPLRESK